MGLKFSRRHLRGLLTSAALCALVGLAGCDTDGLSTTKAQEAATNMKITAQDLMRFGVIDQVLREPAGGAHRDAPAMIATAGDAIAQAFNDLRGLDAATLRQQRRQKFLDIGRKIG